MEFLAAWEAIWYYIVKYVEVCNLSKIPDYIWMVQFFQKRDFSDGRAGNSLRFSANQTYHHVNYHLCQIITILSHLHCNIIIIRSS